MIRTLLVLRPHLKLLLVVLVVFASIAMAMTWSSVRAATSMLTAQGGNVAIGGTIQVPIVLDNAPNGVAGFDLIITLSNGSVGSITGADVMDMGLTTIALISGSEVRVRAVDFNKLVESGVTGATLATLSIQGTKRGATDVNIQVVRLDDDHGSPIIADVLPGAVNVKKNAGSGGSSGKGGGGKGGGKGHKK